MASYRAKRPRDKIPFPPASHAAAAEFLRATEMPKRLRRFLNASNTLMNRGASHRHAECVCVSAETLGDQIGIHPETARADRKWATGEGYITVVEPGGGKGRAMMYRLNWEAIRSLPEKHRSPHRRAESDADTPAPDAGVTAAPNPSVSAAIPQQTAPDTPVSGAGPSEIHHRTTIRAGGGDLHERDEMIRMLASAGVENPEKHLPPGLTLADVEWFVEDTRTAKNPPAAIVARMQRGAKAPAEWADEHRQRQEKRARQAERRNRPDGLTAVLEAMPPDRLLACVRSAVGADGLGDSPETAEYRRHLCTPEGVEKVLVGDHNRGLRERIAKMLHEGSASQQTPTPGSRCSRGAAGTASHDPRRDHSRGGVPVPNRRAPSLSVGNKAGMLT